jgi:hypothetical protein
MEERDAGNDAGIPEVANRTRGRSTLGVGARVAVGGAAPVRRWLVAVIIGVAVTSLCSVHGVRSASAQAGRSDSEVKRPAYQVTRFDDDWSVLQGIDLGKTDDVWDRLKFIPLSADQSVWLTLGGQVRERGEYFQQYLFGASQPKQSDGFLLPGTA